MRYTYVNKFWNADLAAGSKLELGLIIMGNVTLKSIVKVNFNRAPVDITLV